jgi:protocatechuate 3,4-dioxygenase beta subunit
MSKSRRIGIGVGVAGVLAALLLWRCHGNHTSAAATAAPNGTAKVVDVGGVGREIKKLPDPQKAARGSIAGTVRGDDKKPIAGARVCIDGWSRELPEELLHDPICLATDAQGAYRAPNLYAASYVVNAGAKTYRAATFHPDGDRHKSTLRLAAGENKTGVDIVLGKGGVEVTGTISDISGGPIAHAHVSASTGMWGGGESTPMIESDDHGVYSLWTAPGPIRVHASADGYASGSEMSKAPGTVDILLTPESGLSGTVVDGTTGAPIEGAEVSVEATQWSWDGNESDKTDAQGKFKVHRLPPGRYVTTARNDHGYGRTEGSTLVGLGQQVEGVVVKLFPASRIIGKVMIEGSPQKLCVEGNVSFRDEVHDRWVSAVTEPDGTLHADGVLPGTYSAQVYCEGFRAKDHYEPVVIVAGKDLVDQTWIVEAGSTVRGKVLTKSGAPIEGAQISAQTTGGDARAKMDWSSDRSKEDGSYELTALKVSAYKLEVQTTKGVVPREGYKVDVTAGATIQKDLILDDGGSIKGTVVDEQGKPVEDVTIDARPLSDRYYWSPDKNKSASDGSFSIDSVRAGEYRVTANRGWFAELRKPGSTDDTTQGEKVTVEIGKVATVKLVVETQSGTIKGTVTDANGAPVSDAFISSARESDAAGATDSSAHGTRGFGWGDEDKPVLAGVDGSFTVTKLSPGKYTLRAYRKGGGEAIAEHVAVGTTSARLQIKHTGSIEGTAKREGPPPDELTIALEDLKTGLSREESFYRTSGHYIIHDLPAGHFTVTVSADAGQQKVTVDLTEGEAKTGVDVTLEELVNITGRVVDSVTKAPVAGMMVFARPALGQGAFQGFSWGEDDTDHITDAAGKFTVKRAPKGQLAIQGMAKEWKDSDYTWFRVLKTITGTGTVDVGDLTVIKKRIKEGEKPGKLGLHFKESPPDQPPEQAKLEVSFVEPDGPCAKLDIKVGDVIASIDGTDVVGANTMNAWTLMNAPVGTKLAIGLVRGTSISVTLAPP